MSNIQQGALATKPEVMYAANLALLQNLANTQPFDYHAAHTVLNTLASFSPTVRAKLGDLYQANTQAIANNPAQIARLQQICQELQKELQADTAQQLQMQQDLQQLQQDAIAQANEQKAEHTKALQSYLDHARSNKPHLQAIDAETYDTVSRMINASYDKSFFDPLSRIGILFALWLQREFIAPLDQECYANGGFKYAPQKDSYKEQLQKEYGGNVIPVEVPKLRY